MKRTSLMRAVLAGALALPISAFATIDGSHHDIPVYTAADTTPVKEKCAYCHSAVVDPGSTDMSTLGKVGSFCVIVCHLKGSALEASGHTEVVPTSPGVYQAYAAGAIVAGAASYGTDGTMAMTTLNNTDTYLVIAGGHGMDSASSYLSATEKTAIQGTLWPYTATAGASLQCTSCHAVHDAEHPPFLNAQMDKFCQKCHNDPALRWGAGNHPSSAPEATTPITVKWDPTTASTNNREIAVFKNGGTTDLANLQVANAALAAKTDIKDPAKHWSMGGHLLNTSTGLPTTAADANNSFSCVSCHMVHDASGGGTGVAGNLHMVSTDLESVCYGCHTIEPGKTNLGHPIGLELPAVKNHTGWETGLQAKLSVWYKAAADSTEATGLANVHKANATNSPKCITCHDPHGGAANRKAIRKINGKTTYATTDSVCDACHEGSFDNPAVANAHHPGKIGADAVTGYQTKGFPNGSVSWVTQDGNGDLTDGISCQDCHVGDGNSTKNSAAHNWR